MMTNMRATVGSVVGLTLLMLGIGAIRAMASEPNANQTPDVFELAQATPPTGELTGDVVFKDDGVDLSTVGTDPVTLPDKTVVVREKTSDPNDAKFIVTYASPSTLKQRLIFRIIDGEWLFVGVSLLNPDKGTFYFTKVEDSSIPLQKGESITLSDGTVLTQTDDPAVLDQP
jgi:hypothetical protein